jgi:hypothetical protein
MKAFLQPFWAWKTVTLSSGRPSKLLKMLGALLIHIISVSNKSPSPFVPVSTWRAASDAGARNETGRIAIGGWFFDKEPDSKFDVRWFSLVLTKESHPWAFQTKVASALICAFEMYASLVLLVCMFRFMPKCDLLNFFIPFCTDNQGNAFSILNNKTKHWPTSAFLMELLLQASKAGVHLYPAHVKRDFNKWADDLVNGDIIGFNPDLEIKWDENNAEWLVLRTLLSLGKVVPN